MSERVVRSVCPRDCPDVCGMLTHVEDGRVVRVTGDPEHPITKGFLCGRFQHYEELIYHPDRILHPMARTDKSKPLERISWDAALDELAERFSAIMETHGPEAILPYHYLGHMGIVSTRFQDRLWNKMGTARVGAEICAMAGVEAVLRVIGQVRGTEPQHYDKTKLYLVWGKNPKESNIHGWVLTKDIHPLIVIDAYASDSARAADIHVQPRPGTDSMLAIGFMRELIDNGWIDEAFVRDHTNGFEELRERVMGIELDEVSRVTGVPRAQIEEVARLYGTHRPGLIHVGVGLQRNFNGGEMVASISMLGAITGQIGTAGGGVLYANYDWKLNDVSHAELRGNVPVMHNMIRLGRDLTEYDEIKALFIYNQNPAATVPNQRAIHRGMARDDLFVVDHELYMTDTAQRSDMVLPACTFAECTDLHLSYWHDYVRINNQAIEPLGESRSNSWVIRELAKRLGYTEPCFSQTDEEVMAAALEGTGLDIEELKERAVLWGDPGSTSFEDRRYPTPSGRLELMAPTFTPDAPQPQRYRLLTPKTHHLHSSQVFNLPRKFAAVKTPWVFVHPDDAEREGIATGDEVRLHNDLGSVDLVAYVSQRTQPGLLVTYMVRWGANANATTTDEPADMGGNSAFHSTYVDLALHARAA
jgi:anaerobic selenocysteine-containing dehydrogenase